MNDEDRRVVPETKITISDYLEGNIIDRSENVVNKIVCEEELDSKEYKTGQGYITIDMDNSDSRTVIKEECAKNEKDYNEKYGNIQVFVAGSPNPMYPNPYQTYGAGYPTSQHNNDFIAPETGERLDYDPSRNSFVLKVFSILCLMLLATAGIMTLIYALPASKAFFMTKTGSTVTIVFMCLILSLNCCLMCIPQFRNPPWCYLLLTLTVLFMSIGVGGLVCMYQITTVIISFVATAAVVMLCIALACTRFDFTRFLLYVIVAVFALAICGLAYGIFAIASGQRVKELHIAILFLQTIVSSVMFVIEIQMVLGGKTVELTTDEWAFAAFLLYTSVMDLFIKILITAGMLDEGR